MPWSKHNSQPRFKSFVRIMAGNLSIINFRLISNIMASSMRHRVLRHNKKMALLRENWNILEIARALLLGAYVPSHHWWGGGGGGRYGDYCYVFVEPYAFQGLRFQDSPTGSFYSCFFAYYVDASSSHFWVCCLCPSPQILIWTHVQFSACSWAMGYIKNVIDATIPLPIVPI